MNENVNIQKNLVLENPMGKISNRKFYFYQPGTYILINIIVLNKKENFGIALFLNNRVDTFGKKLVPYFDFQ